MSVPLICIKPAERSVVILQGVLWTGLVKAVPKPGFPGLSVGEGAAGITPPAALGCTERTIKVHRHGVMEKMQVHSLTELVSLAERISASAAGGIT